MDSGRLPDWNTKGWDREYHKTHGFARLPDYEHWYEPRADSPTTGYIYCVCGLGKRTPTPEDVN